MHKPLVRYACMHALVSSSAPREVLPERLLQLRQHRTRATACHLHQVRAQLDGTEAALVCLHERVAGCHCRRTKGHFFRAACTAKDEKTNTEDTCVERMRDKKDKKMKLT